MSKENTSPLRIALVGLGTVGAGVVRLLNENAGLISARAGRDIEIVAVSARDRSRDRGIDISAYEWVDDMGAIGERADIDVVVELVGGADGPALALARRAISAGKGFVTANKAMIAHHGLALAAAAEQAGTMLCFEAAVAGGIPVLKGLREGVAANEIERIYGILNGTANYILSSMEATGADFAVALKEAKALGYAEADPTFDIEGVDAAHKLSILASIAFGTKLDFAGVTCEGISRIKASDIHQAKALGYVVRLLGSAELDKSGMAPALLQQVRPCLVPKSNPLAHVKGATNAVVAKGNYVGQLLFQGAGAGDAPTASAVVSDIIDIARNSAAAPFSVPCGNLAQMERADGGLHQAKHYIRFSVTDKPGVLAEITAALRDAGVSIESLIQEGREEAGGEVLVALVTHDGPRSAVDKALALLQGSESLTGAPLVMPIVAG